MIIYNVITNEKIAEVVTNHSLTLDEALNLVTEAEPYLNEDNNMTYIVNGREVYYDDLDIRA